MPQFTNAPHDDDDVQDLWYALNESGFFTTDGSAEFVRARNDARGTSIETKVQPEQTSLFDDLKTVRRDTVIDLVSSFGTSELRDVITSSGSGSIDPNPDPTTGEFVLSTGTTSGSSITIESGETGRYTPGHSAQVGIGIRASNNFSDDEQIRWGYYTPGGDGFIFGKDVNTDTGSSELYIAILEDGSEINKTYRSSWNGADVDNVLDRTTDLLNEGAIWQINFAWYGYGVIEWSVVSQDNNNEQKTTILHRESRRTRTSIADPNSRITAEADNGTTTTDIDLRVGGRQFSILGSVPSEERVTAHTRLGPSGAGTTSWTYVMAFRRSPGEFNSRFDVSGIDALQNDGARYALFFVSPEFVSSAVTGQSWQAPNDVKSTETLLEVDVSGSFSTIGDANKIWEGLATGGSNQPGTLRTPDLSANLPQQGQLVLGVRGTSATVDVEAATLKMLEDW